jgi:hypothetical protein
MAGMEAVKMNQTFWDIKETSTAEATDARKRLHNISLELLIIVFKADAIQVG